MKKIYLTALLPLLCFVYLIFSASAALFAPAPFPFTSKPQIITAQAQNENSTDAPAVPTAGDYACILSDNAFFYAAPDEKSGLFLLPKSYYVRLLSYATEYCKIEYQTDGGGYEKLVGYAKTNQLTFVKYIPLRPYFSYVFEVSYRLDSTSQENSDFLNKITFDCAYYGDYKVGSNTYCYVLRNGEFGYVPKPEDLFLEENTEYNDYLASLTTPEPPSSSDVSTEPTETPSSPAQIAILVALCLLVPLLAALILKPPRRPPYETEE